MSGGHTGSHTVIALSITFAWITFVLAMIGLGLPWWLSAPMFGMMLAMSVSHDGNEANNGATT